MLLLLAACRGALTFEGGDPPAKPALAKPARPAGGGAGAGGAGGSQMPPMMAPASPDATVAPDAQAPDAGATATDAVTAAPDGPGATTDSPTTAADMASIANIDRPPADAPAPADAATDATPTITLRFVPPGQTFRDMVDLRLETDVPGATIHYTLDDRPPNKASSTYSTPIRLTTSTVVRAFVSTPAGDGGVKNQGYVKLLPDAAAFTSNLPIFLVHSYRTRPLSKADGVRQATLLVFEPNPATGRAALLGTPTLDTRIGIRVRGSSSEGFEKKQYKIELWDGVLDEDKDKAVLGLPAESDWIINDGFPFDRAHLRNAFTFAVSNRIGRYAPRTKFVEVIFTDARRDVAMTDYIGLYTLMEKIKIAGGRLELKKLTALSVNPPEVTGGYIFKIDRIGPAEMGFFAGRGPNNVYTSACAGKQGICDIMQPLVFEDPDEVGVVAAQKAYLTRTVDEFANALGGAQDYTRFMDSPSFVDHHVVNTLTKNPDAFRLSGLFHKDRDGKINAGPVWDFDRTMGCANDDRSDNPTWWDPTNQTADATRFFDYGWYRTLFEDVKFRTAYFARWKELQGTELTTAKLHALVDELSGPLAVEAAARDARRWPAAAPRTGVYADEIKLLKDWLRQRNEWIASCLPLADPRTCAGR